MQYKPFNLRKGKMHDSKNTVIQKGEMKYTILPVLFYNVKSYNIK